MAIGTALLVALGVSLYGIHRRWSSRRWITLLVVTLFFSTVLGMIANVHYFDLRNRFASPTPVAAPPLP